MTLWLADATAAARLVRVLPKRRTDDFLGSRNDVWSRIALSPTPERQLAGFIAKFTPEMAALIRSARSRMRKRIPKALELVYDNYNFFVIGYGPNERPRDAIFSLAAQAKGLSLCFLQGAGLPDPKGLLRGSGNLVRSIRLDSAAALTRPEVRALIAAALQRAKTPLPADGRHRLIIKSVSAKQRPRRLATTKLQPRKRK